MTKLFVYILSADVSRDRAAERRSWASVMFFFGWTGEGARDLVIRHDQSPLVRGGNLLLARRRRCVGFEEPLHVAGEWADKVI